MTERTHNADFRRKPLIFADSPFLLEIQAFGGHKKLQKTALESKGEYDHFLEILEIPETLEMKDPFRNDPLSRALVRVPKIRTKKQPKDKGLRTSGAHALGYS